LLVGTLLGSFHADVRGDVFRQTPHSRMPSYTPHSTTSLQCRAERPLRCSYWLLRERPSPIDRKQRSRSLSGPFRCSATSPLGVA
jgi:hypothetical protein